MLVLTIIFMFGSISTKPFDETWDYFLFVQLWPANWLIHDHIRGNNFTNNYFNVHGLWAEDYNGSWPQFCNTSKSFDANILKPIHDNLTKYWTDFKNPPLFWKHEYLKHLTCINQTDLYGDYKYFWYGLELRNKLDIFSALSKFDIVPTNDHYYSTKEIMNTIKKIYGYDVVVTCTKNNIIEEVRFCMDKYFKLFDCPKTAYKDNCRSDNILYNVYNG